MLAYHKFVSKKKIYVNNLICLFQIKQAMHEMTPGGLIVGSVFILLQMNPNESK